MLLFFGKELRAKRWLGPRIGIARVPNFCSVALALPQFHRGDTLRGYPNKDKFLTIFQGSFQFIHKILKIPVRILFFLHSFDRFRVLDHLL